MTDAERKEKIDSALASLAIAQARSRADVSRQLAEIREVWTERAAIREYLGGLRHRRNAELHAVADTFEIFNARVPPRRKR